MSDPKMPDEDWDDDLGRDDDGGALHDPLLQQVLDHAPDQAATPDTALRQSIRVLAHEAVAPSLPAGPVGAERPWWQRLLGIGGGAGSRMPWNAAFATVLVGVLVTVMWQREPVPGAAPDVPMQERQAAPVPAAPPTPVTPAPASKPAEAPPPPPAPSVLDTALAESRAVTESAKRALDERDRERERQARQAAADREATLAADKAVERAQQALAREEAARMKAEPPLPPPVQWPPAPEPVAPAAPSVSAAPPAALRAAPPVASVPSRAAGMAAPAPAPAAPAPSPTPEPSFNALAQWTQLRISRNGADSRVLPRAEARELGGLVGSAALAGVGSQPLAGAVDWRIALERDGEVLGVLELAGGQVRWREKGVPPGTGQPGAGALSSLRQALEEAR